jgi:TRAP-type C4-dicarboxylate transport system permease small subunit
VRWRCRLAFTEIRMRFPYSAQYACAVLDCLLWIGFASVVIWRSLGPIELLLMNFAVARGADEVMQWWFHLASPVGWGLIVVRSVQNMVEDTLRFASGRPMARGAALGDG